MRVMLNVTYFDYENNKTVTEKISERCFERYLENSSFEIISVTF